MQLSFFNKTTIPLFIIFFLFGVGFSYLFFQFDQNRIQGSWQTRSTFSYLFIFEDEQGAYRFGQVYVYNTETQKSFFIDLPREAAYEEKGSAKISWLSKLYSEEGSESFLSRISGLIGETIDFYFVFTPRSLEGIVDLLSGTPIFIDEAIDMKDQEQGEYTLIPSGHVVLDGEKANQYLRYFRTLTFHSQRQAFLQSFLVSWIESKDFLTRSDVLKIFYHFFRTNVYSPIFLEFLLEKWVSPKENALFFYIRGPMQTISEQKIDIIFPTALSGENLLKEQMRRGLRYINDYNKLEDISVEVLNGTNKTGLAKKVAEAMEYLGYRVVRVGNTEKPEEKTVLINNKGNMSKVRVFSELIKVDNIRNIGNAESSADVTIILGSDFDEHTIRE